MRFKAYIRVLSDEITIRDLHQRTMMLGATVTQLRAPREGTDEMWWNWQTEHREIDAEDVDSGVRALLEASRPLFPEIRKCQGPSADIYLELVGYYERNERPAGLYLSAESIRMLGELGAALDHDVVPAVFPAASAPGKQ